MPHLLEEFVHASTGPFRVQLPRFGRVRNIRNLQRYLHLQQQPCRFLRGRDFRQLSRQRRARGRSFNVLCLEPAHQLQAETVNDRIQPSCVNQFEKEKIKVNAFTTKIDLTSDHKI